MRLSILVDENTTTLEPPVVMENADRPIPDLSRLADEEHPETTEYLFIGAPPASWWQHVLHAAGIGVLAVVALTTWLLTASSVNDTGPQPAMSAAALPQQSMLASRKRCRVRETRRPISGICPVLPEQPRPLRADCAPGAGRRRLHAVLPEQRQSVRRRQTSLAGPVR